MAKPAHCTHVAYPVCGCQHPPVAATNVINVAERREQQKKAAKLTRSRGNPGARAPKTDRQELVDRLPTIMSDPYLRQQLAQAIMTESCRKDLATYCREAWHVVEPTTTLEWNWHHELLCNVVQGLFEDWERAQDDRKFVQRVTQAVINVPPGSLKSRILAVFFPTWAWLRRPGWRVICLSVNEDAAMRDARDSRTLIKSDWYQDTFQPEWQLKQEQDAISNYANSKGGVRLSRAQGSEIVGLRGDCFRQNTSVSTELGPISIGELHEMAERNQPLPRVLSYNHHTGQTEFKSILATRKIRGRRTVDVQIADQVVTCTHAHRFFSQGSYTQAAHLGGRTVSCLRGADMPVEKQHASALPELSLRETDVCALPDPVPEIGGGVRQARTPRTGGRSVLFQELQDAPYAGAGRDEVVCDLRGSVQAQVSSSESVLLFQEVCGQAAQPARSDSHGQVLALSAGVRVQDTETVLHAEMRVPRSHARGLDPRAVRNVLETAPTARDEAGRVLRQLREYGDVDCASRQPRSTSERVGESRDDVQELSRSAPPHEARESSVLLDHEATVRDRGETHDVYDIQVEGNHNFFAAGILVHNCLIVDDANNPKEAESKLVRDSVNDLYTTNIHNRVNHPTKSLRIGIQQRTHMDDWTGYIVKHYGVWTEADPDPNKWLHVVIPAEFEPERRCVTPWGSDPRTVKGQPLHDARMTREWIAATRQQYGSQKYAGQYQQRPTAAEGGMVKVAWWRFFQYADQKLVPERKDRGPENIDVEHPTLVVPLVGTYTRYWDFDWTVISCDLAAKKTDRGSQHGILVISGKGPKRFVRHDATFRGDILEVLATVKKLCARFDPDRILIEDKAMGDDLATMFRAAFQTGDVRGSNGKYLPVVVEKVAPGSQGKEARLDACLPEIEAGLVYLLEGADWVEPFVGEVCGFPLSSHDDRVDAMSQCLNWARSRNGYVMPDW